MNHRTMHLIWACLLALCLTTAAASIAQARQGFPVKGKVTLLELGSPLCPPCRAMAPILEDLAKDFRGKVAIVKVDVRYDRDTARYYGIRMIPTQIYFDAKGREVYRHTGFMDRPAIEAVFTSLGVN